MSDELVEAVAAKIADAMGDVLEMVPANKSEWNKARGMCGGVPRDINMPFRSDYDAAARAAIAVVIERCAKVADKRADDRFAEHGVTEYDTNASYYSGSRAEAYDELDEEDWAIARDIRKLGESDDRG